MDPDVHGDVPPELYKEEKKLLKKDRRNYIEIPRMEARDSFRIMAAFAEQLDDSNPLKQRLNDALSFKNPFSNFKYLIDSSGDYRQHWFDFKVAKTEE
jgi:hypothetical protein